MSKTAGPIILSPDEHTTQIRWTRQRSLPLWTVQRTKIIQMAEDGVQNQDIALKVGVSCPTVQLWRQRFRALRLPGLEKDAPRPGRIPKILEKKIRAVIEATLHSTPPNATH